MSEVATVTGGDTTAEDPPGDAGGTGRKGGRGVAGFVPQALSDWRQQAQLEQDDLAQAAGKLTIGAISHYERGIRAPTVYRLGLICAALTAALRVTEPDHRPITPADLVILPARDLAEINDQIAALPEEDQAAAAAIARDRVAARAQDQLAADAGAGDGDR
jgi:transcriptional regulator with XRE-family HTH domain